MAKTRKTFVRDKKQESVYETFKTLKTKAGWSITCSLALNKKWGVFELRDEVGIRFTDIRSEVCKNVAEQRYGIAQDEWAEAKS